MHRDILPSVIFSPAKSVLSLVSGLQTLGVEVTLFSPGPIDTSANNITADLTYFEHELKLRGDTYLSLLKKHPFTFVTLARQVQSELIAKAYNMANQNKFDAIHIYTNEEDIALAFAELCQKPTVFTHHDPFNFLVKYKNTFPKYKDLNWISISYAQRQSMPADTNWVGNVYHGLDEPELTPLKTPSNDYTAYLGRIIQPKGVHLAILATLKYNQTAKQPLKLKIAGKHYAGQKDKYWQNSVLPYIDGKNVEYIGFIDTPDQEREFLGNAVSLIMPSLFDEPFGLVAIEALACGTPVIGLNSGAIPEVICHDKIGLIVNKVYAKNGVIDDIETSALLAKAIAEIGLIERPACRREYEKRFTAEQMCRNYMGIYRGLLTK
jgi:glycosyltransferase involved in cell wall biosynthesis